MQAGRETNMEGSAQRRPEKGAGARTRSGARTHASTAAALGPLGAVLAGLALAALPPAADAGPKARYPALQPAPDTTTQGPPKGGAQTQETSPCGTVPCALAAPPRQVLAFDDPRGPLPHVKPVADTGPAQAAPGRPADDPSRIATLRDVFARADPLPGRRIGVSVGFCVARPPGQEKPAPVRLALAEARTVSGEAGQAARPRMHSLLELRFVWREVGVTDKGEPKDCYLAAQAYKRRPELLELRGLEPREPDGLRIQNAFQIDVLKLEPPPEPKPGQAPYPAPKPGQAPKPEPKPGQAPTAR